VVCRVCNWWRQHLTGPLQDHALWKDVNLSNCAPHATTDRVLELLSSAHPQILSLDLKFCSKISDASLEKVATLKHLQRLDVEGCGRKLSDTGLAHLAQCSTLTHLSLSGCQRITPPVLERVLKSVGKLKVLSVGGMTALEDKNVQSILAAAPTITQLILNSCSKITDAGVKYVGERCANQLVELELGYCAAISDDAVQVLALHCPNLTSLNLYGCFKLTDRSLEWLGRDGGGKLRKINLGMCRGLSDQGIRFLLEGKKNCAKSLEWLNLYDCTRLTKDAIIRVAKLCVKLRHLELCGLDSLEEKTINDLLSHATKLETLDLGGCQKLSSEYLAKLNKSHPYLFT